MNKSLLSIICYRCSLATWGENTVLNSVTVFSLPQQFHHYFVLDTLWINLSVWKIQTDGSETRWNTKQNRTGRCETLKRAVWKWGKPYKLLLVFVTYDTLTGLNCWQPQRYWERSPLVYLESWKTLTENANKQRSTETQYVSFGFNVTDDAF